MSKTQLRNGEMDHAMTLRMPTELYQQLRAIAEAEDRTIAGLLRNAAKKVVAEYVRRSST